MQKTWTLSVNYTDWMQPLIEDLWCWNVGFLLFSLVTSLLCDVGYATMKTSQANTFISGRCTSQSKDDVSCILLQGRNQLIILGGKVMSLVAVPNKYICFWKFRGGAIAQLPPLVAGLFYTYQADSYLSQI